MKTKLIPPDRKRCQALKRSFMTLGPGWVGCSDKPVVIVTEKKPDADGERGSMSLCSECLKEFHKRMGKDFATEEIIG